MVWRGPERDLTADTAASDVLAAYEAAVGARLPTSIATSLVLKHGDGCILTNRTHTPESKR